MDETLKILFKLCIDYYNKKEEKYKELGIDTNNYFNFFESISDKWYREDFHSDILYTILNPNTPQFGQKFFMKLFLTFLGLSQEKFDCNTYYDVIREASTGYIYWEGNDKKIKKMKGRIDILIKNDKKQAIIIENKINYAPDQENQLVRYMKYVKEDLEINQIEKINVVYLTLKDDDSGPDFSSYDTDFKDYTNYLKSNIIKKHAVGYSRDDKKCMTNNFLDNCLKLLEGNDLVHTYINQYKIMLEHLGGEVYMENINEEFINKTFSSKDNYNAVKAFFDIWESRRKYIEEVIKKDLEEEGFDFLLQQVHDCPDFYAWKHSSGEYCYFWDGDKEVGFAANPEKIFDDETQELLFEKIKTMKTQINTKNIKRMTRKNNANIHFVFCDFNETENLIKEIEKALKFLKNSSPQGAAPQA